MQHSTVGITRRALPGSFAALAPARTVQTDAGAFFLYHPTPGIVFSECVGHIDQVLAAGLKEFGDRVMASDGRTAYFHDWDSCTGYDTDSRKFLTAWAVERRASIRSVAVLSRSKIVTMGVAAANLATSALGLQMSAHNSRTAFDKEFLAATAGR